MTDNLMCSNARQWHCWNSVGYDGALAVERVVDLIKAELYRLALGLTSPLVQVLSPPDDYAKLRRHKNAKYRFLPLEGYPPLPFR